VKVMVTRLGSGTSRWSVALQDGKPVCEIRVRLSSTRNASLYYVLEGETVVQEGHFNFLLWDWAAIEDLLTKLVRRMYPDAEIVIEVPSDLKAANG
jgi:hypothetical protein